MTTTAVAVTVSTTAPKMITITGGKGAAAAKATTTGRQPTATTTGGQAIATAAGVMKDPEVPTNAGDQETAEGVQVIRAGPEVPDQVLTGAVPVDNAATPRVIL